MSFLIPYHCRIVGRTRFQSGPAFGAGLLHRHPESPAGQQDRRTGTSQRVEPGRARMHPLPVKRPGLQHLHADFPVLPGQSGRADPLDGAAGHAPPAGSVGSRKTGPGQRPDAAVRGFTAEAAGPPDAVPRRSFRLDSPGRRRRDRGTRQQAPQSRRDGFLLEDA